MQSKSRTGSDKPSHRFLFRPGIVDLADVLLAVLLISVCSFFYWESANFPSPGLFLGDNVLPEEFPRLLLVAIGMLALLLPFEHKLEPTRWPLIKKSRSAPLGLPVISTMFFIVLLVAIGEWLGTVLTIFIAAAGLPLLWGERRWWLSFGYALIFTSIITYLFSIVLSVYFEPGVFGLTLR